MKRIFLGDLDHMLSLVSFGYHPSVCGRKQSLALVAAHDRLKENNSNSITEDISTQATVSDGETGIFISPLPDAASQRKLSKIPLQKHPITVKLLSPLARLQGTSDSKAESVNSNLIVYL